MTILTRLLARSLDANAALFAELEAGRITVDSWQQRMAQSLFVQHAASYMAGRGDTVLRRVDKDAARRAIAPQIDWLNGFADVMAAAAEPQWDRWRARAALYAGAIKESHARGQADGYELPGYPGKDTLCMTNCRCSVEIEWIDKERGDLNMYWRRSAEESCQTCVDREAFWNPYPIRNGVGAAG